MALRKSDWVLAKDRDRCGVQGQSLAGLPLSCTFHARPRSHERHDWPGSQGGRIASAGFLTSRI